MRGVWRLRLETRSYFNIPCATTHCSLCACPSPTTLPNTCAHEFPNLPHIHTNTHTVIYTYLIMADKYRASHWSTPSSSMIRAIFAEKLVRPLQLGVARATWSNSNAPASCDVANPKCFFFPLLGPTAKHTSSAQPHPVRPLQHARIYSHTHSLHPTHPRSIDASLPSV